MTMQLSELLKPFVTIPAQVDRVIMSLAVDSRRVEPHSLFIAVKGTQMDGREFIPNALARGATAILIDADAQREPVVWEGNVPLVAIPDLSRQVPLLAAHFYGHPADKLKLIGVTGTNGKTSCTHFIAQLLQSQQMPCGIIGTLGCGMYGQLVETGLTTPDAVTLQKHLREFVQKGASAVAMEVSSHSIDQGRVNTLPFEIGIFTNLTQDHLDYHGTMQAYAAVKHRFLAQFPIKQLIVNVDDSYGAQWAAEFDQRVMVTYSTRKPDRVRDNHVYCDKVKLDLKGMQATVYTPWGDGQLELPLVGLFNLSNALAALAAVCLRGVAFEQALAGLKNLKPVPGRMQSLGGHGKPMVVVDYAHTPDALEKVLQALRHHTAGRLICVFGCGGDRDAGKRPLMAQIAERGADQVIVTNDNPRHEAPDVILKDIMAGFAAPDRIQVELDRAKAIQKSIQLAAVNDCVLIAGKGAEQYQQIGDVKLPFDDVSCAENILGESIC